MLRRHVALDLGQKSVWERNPHSQTEMGQQNSTNKKPHRVPEEAKLTYNLCGGQQGTERQAEDNRQGADPTWLFTWYKGWVGFTQILDNPKRILPVPTISACAGAWGWGWGLLSWLDVSVHISVCGTLDAIQEQIFQLDFIQKECSSMWTKEQ